MIDRALAALLAAHTAQDGFYAEHELLHREGLGDVVIGTDLEAFEDVLLEGLGGEEDDGDVGVGLADFLCQGEAVFLGHHHVEHADVELGLEECLVAGFSVGAELSHVAFGIQILA